MAKSRKSMKRKSMKRRMSKKGRKGSRRRMRGGEAPVGFNHTSAMPIQLAQGEQFAKFHENQHGGALAYGDYPGAISDVLPSDMAASAKLTGLNQAFDYIKQFGPSSDNPNLSGGRRRKSKKSRKSRKSKKISRKQRGGLYRWGGGGKKVSKKSKKSKKSRKQRGGAYAEMRFPMPVSQEGKMLIPPSMEAQAGLNFEWNLAKDPMAFAPKM
jgi:hypothetical protein